MTTVDPNLMLQSLTQANRANTQAALQQKVLENALSIGTVGLGAGIGARSLWGLAQQASRNARKRRPTVPAPLEVEIPVEEIPGQEKLATNPLLRAERALTDGAQRIGYGAGEQLSRVPMPPSEAENTGTLFTGGQRATRLNHPGAILGPTTDNNGTVIPGGNTRSQIANNALYSGASSPGFKPAPLPLMPAPRPMQKLPGVSNPNPALLRAPQQRMGAMDEKARQNSSTMNFPKDGSSKRADQLPVPPAMPTPIASVPAAPSFLGGGSATEAAGHPLAYPLWAAAGLGSVGAGWKLTDWLLDKRRRRNMKQELDAAKGEYNDALYGKTAAALEGVFEKISEVKQADWYSDLKASMGNTAGKGLGLYGVYAGGGALASGLMAYGIAKKRQRRTLLEAAQKERQRQRYETMPTPIYATPVPVSREQTEQAPSSPFAAPSLV